VVLKHFPLVFVSALTLAFASTGAQAQDYRWLDDDSNGATCMPSFAALLERIDHAESAKDVYEPETLEHFRRQLLLAGHSRGAADLMVEAYKTRGLLKNQLMKGVIARVFVQKVGKGRKHTRPEDLQRFFSHAQAKLLSREERLEMVNDIIRELRSTLPKPSMDPAGMKKVDDFAAENKLTLLQVKRLTDYFANFTPERELELQSAVWSLFHPDEKKFQKSVANTQDFWGRMFAKDEASVPEASLKALPAPKEPGNSLALRPESSGIQRMPPDPSRFAGERQADPRLDDELRTLSQASARSRAEQLYLKFRDDQQSISDAQFYRILELTPIGEHMDQDASREPMHRKMKELGSGESSMKRAGPSMISRFSIMPCSPLSASRIPTDSRQCPRRSGRSWRVTCFGATKVRNTKKPSPNCFRA
jgi:hypothetical protein